MNHHGFHRFLGEIGWLIIMVKHYGWLIINSCFQNVDSIGLLLDHIGRFDEEDDGCWERFRAHTFAAGAINVR